MISDERFPKEERLVKTKDFRRVYKEGASVKKSSLILYHLPNALGTNRIGFSIRSSNIKLASSRNRIRRLLREAYRRNKRFLKKGFDMVVVVKSGLPRNIAYKAVEWPFLKLIKDSGILL